MNEQEIEVKLLVRDLPALEQRLQTLGARLVQARTYEQNLRFDTPEGKLRQSFQVLRLRRDLNVYLTYKGPAETIEGARVRKEIEISVSDFQTTWHLLLELGYQVSMIYEKYRTVYDLQNSLVSLDELPYGNFIEIEGPDPAVIYEINQKLGLNWESRVPESYTALFEDLQLSKGLDFRDLIFENFAGMKISPQDLNIIPADN
jgi:adenylate cyclase, class 2